MSAEALADAGVRGPATRLADLPLVLEPAEAAELLRISKWHLYESAKRGEIRALRLGRALRIPRAEIARLLGLEDSDAGPTTGPAAATAVTPPASNAQESTRGE